MPLMPADVRNKQFATTRLRPGYDEEEVDDFLDEVEAEMERLLQENQELRAQLAERAGGSTPAAPALSSALTEPGPERMAAEPGLPGPQRTPARGPIGGPGQEPSMDTVARVLVLAQQTADQALADARRGAGETLGRARRAADEILGKARGQAEQITSDAQAVADSLQRDAQERYHQATGSLVREREELERRVEDLRAFERDYRSRLKAYLEDQLRDLAADAADSEPFPHPDRAAGGHVIGRL
jgi:DivIVA domain-containing protein